MRKGQETRTRVMDIAEVAILSKGYGATSIEEIIEEAGITKSGFFYHFPDKRALALALLLVHGVSDCVHRWTHDIHSNGILYRGIVGQNICHSGMGYIEDKAKCITLKGWIKREVYEGTFKMAARRATAALSHKIVLFVLSP